MNDKVIIVLIDGLRPDAVKKTDYLYGMAKSGVSSFSARTIVPPVTITAITSMFSGRHTGFNTLNTDMLKPEWPEGLAERVCQSGKSVALYYTWDELRELCKPGSVDKRIFINIYKTDKIDEKITDAAIDDIAKNDFDLSFVYLGYTDSAGHKYGWMSKEYFAAVAGAFACLKRIAEKFPSRNIIVTADHGGHGTGHGDETDEDMLIPIVIKTHDKKRGKIVGGSILDIAPTVAGLLGVESADGWQGKDLLSGLR
jgi:predicted AlkP superfamily pyrophosphatase or phosphodiesterase